MFILSSWWWGRWTLRRYYKCDIVWGRSHGIISKDVEEEETCRKWEAPPPACLVSLSRLTCHSMSHTTAACNGLAWWLSLVSSHTTRSRNMLHTWLIKKRSILPWIIHCEYYNINCGIKKMNFIITEQVDGCLLSKEESCVEFILKMLSKGNDSFIMPFST